MAIISRPSIPEVIFERVKTDLTEFAFNFFQDGLALDVSSRTYKIRLKASGVIALDKASSTNASGRVTFVLTDAEKTNLKESEYQLFLVELLAGGGEKTLMAGTLRWSVPFGKPTGLVSAPDVSVNYITATQELMVALGVVDFGSMSSAASAAQAEAAKLVVIQTQSEVLDAKIDIDQAKAEIDASQQSVLVSLGQINDRAEQVQQDRIIVEQARDDISLSQNPLGGYNAALNIPAQTATPPASEPNGSYLEIEVAGTAAFAGSNFVIGTALPVGGRLVKKDANTWRLQPPSDLSLKRVQEIEKTVKPNNSGEILLPVLDRKRRLLSGFTKAGQWFASRILPGSIPRSALGTLGINLADLTSEVKDMFFKFLNPSTGYIFGILAKRRMILMVRTNGSVYIPRLEYNIPAGVVQESALSSGVASKLNQGVINTSDRVVADDDGLIRGVYFDISAKTSYNGSLFSRFPKSKTPYLQGINDSGQALEFRKTNGLTIRGEKYIGTYALPGINEVSSKGLTNVAPSTAGRTAGDWYKIGTTSGGTVTINGVAHESGDLTVFDGTNFVKKPAPSPSGSSQIGHFWIVSNAGIFDGVSYSIGDIIYMEAKQAAGGPFYRHFAKGKPGEYFFAGSFNPSTFVPPTTLANGLVYIASAGGTYDGKTFVRNDMLVRQNNAWHLLATEPVITVPAGSFFSLRTSSADEWEVRRLDTSDTQVGVTAKGAHALLQKQSTESIVMYGDSMVGALSPLPALIPTRTVVSRSFGGGTSEDIVSMIEREIRQGDPYKGYFALYYFGQNNFTDVSQTRECAERMLSLRGARDNRFLFISILGERSVTYDGVRMVATTQENAFNRTGNAHIYQVEQYYETAYPGNYINIRQVLLASAASLTAADLLSPGKTQAETAALYGHVPLSYFLDYTALPYPAGEWVFKGYQTAEPAAGSGTDKDYFIKNTGDFWLRVGGNWTTITWDRVHVSAAARPLFAQAVQTWLTTNKQ